MPKGKHLRRLDEVWSERPIYFVTTCVAGRRPLLANTMALAIFRSECEAAPKRYGWRVGRFVLMPDHAHFFCAPEGNGALPLSRFVGGLKQWTSKRLLSESEQPGPVWQAEFFDHVLRSGESYNGKWAYMLENPVRAGLVVRAPDWPYAGEISPLEW